MAQKKWTKRFVIMFHDDYLLLLPIFIFVFVFKLATEHTPTRVWQTKIKKFDKLPHNTYFAISLSCNLPSLFASNICNNVSVYSINLSSSICSRFASRKRSFKKFLIQIEWWEGKKNIKLSNYHPINKYNLLLVHLLR